MTARPRRLPRPEHGFVLVGVIIFVLALTILALSLYGLSGFEAQFLEQNVAHDQAFYRAESGQELVKQLLSQTLPDSSYYLQNAHKAIGLEGVVDATAWQVNGANTITTGLVDWSLPVYINVKATDGGETRTVEGQFIGAPRRDPYQQLITSSNWILYGDNNMGMGLGLFPDRRLTVTLNGRIWQDSTRAPDVSWQNVVTWSSGAPVLREHAPTPLASAFIAGKLAQAVPLSYVNIGANPLVVNLNGDPSGGTPTFFTGPTSLPLGPITAAFTLYDNVKTTVNVTGVCVWMFPNGVRFDQPVEIKGNGPNPVLIIVAGPNGTYVDQFGEDFRDRAIWFFETLDLQPNVSVYLVTDGVTDIEDFLGADPSCSMNQLSIFTNGLWFLGPGHNTAQPTQTQNWSMSYPPGMDALASQLESMGALPVPSGVANGTMTLVPGSWREP